MGFSNFFSIDMKKIIRTLVPESERMATADKLFGLYYILGSEPTVYSMAENLCPQYNGGYWEFYTLSNGGFYMAPRTDTVFKVHKPNGFDGKLTGDALGVLACLCACNYLSVDEGRVAEVCGIQYHLLRAFAIEHNEALTILAAID